MENTSAYTTLQTNKLYASEDSDGDGFTDVVEDLTGSDKDDANNTPDNYLDGVGIVDLENVMLFNVFPNPTKDIVNIKIETNNNVAVQVELLDVLGRTVLNTELNNGVASFNVSKLNKGIYIVSATSQGKAIATTSLVVN